MILIKNKAAIAKMKVAGRILASVMNEVSGVVVEGSNTLDIDSVVESKLRAAGLKPECKGYAGYQYATCISLNDVVIHGVPSKKVVLKSGDFVKIDVVGSYKNYCADITRFFFVGEVSTVVKKLAETAQEALDKAIQVVAAGIRLSDVSSIIQQTVEDSGFSVIRRYAGHGIGKMLHESPDVPNYGLPGSGPVLQAGMALAIEPMITEFDYDVKIMDDGWTVRTADGGLSAHVEDTIIVCKNGSDIITRNGSF
jgi:methionyl aminopeptidase